MYFLLTPTKKDTNEGLYAKKGVFSGHFVVRARKPEKNRTQKSLGVRTGPKFVILIGGGGSRTRLQWLWGRTSWFLVAPFWDLTKNESCTKHAKPQLTPWDLFSAAAMWSPIRDRFFSTWDPQRPLEQWFSTANPDDQRNFIRSLIPSSLVAVLRVPMERIQIQSLINHRDSMWDRSVSQARIAYAARATTQGTYPFSKTEQRTGAIAILHSTSDTPGHLFVRPPQRL